MVVRVRYQTLRCATKLLLMSVHIHRLDASRVGRSQVFAGLYAVGMLNGVFWSAIREVSVSSPMEALTGGFGVNWALWFCGLIAVQLTWEEPDAQVTRLDLFAFAAFVPFVLWPEGRTAWVGLTLLAGYAVLSGRRAATSTAGAMVVLTMTVPLVWAKFAVHFFGPWLERADLVLLHLVTGVQTRGNLVFFPGGNDNLVIAWPCTSFSNLSIAVALWMAVTRTFRPIPRPGEWRTLMLIAVALVAMNSVRLYLMSRSREMYVTIHEPATFAVINLLLLGVTAALAVHGVRHELRR